MNAYDETAERVRAFLDERKLTHPVLLQGGTTARNSYIVRSYPTAFLIDRSGNILSIHHGASEARHAAVRRAIDLALKAPAPK